MISTVYKHFFNKTKEYFSPFTCAPKPKEVFAKLWKAAYPIHIGHCPGVSAEHRNITAFCPLFALMCLCNFPPMVAYTFVTPISSGQASAYRPTLQTKMLTLLGDLWSLLGLWTHNLLLDSRNSLSLTLGCWKYLKRRTSLSMCVFNMSCYEQNTSINLLSNAK